ncbi:hypothetical protein Taro_032194 [Colocasia esculenta]|uniref:Uncharacterized protein n=1 Tax=Colocasia esculenta TaxID=4460 RepID=A0A843VS21_COLES|nr:hypothetical protein [Colocasia esculenta]
MASIQLTSPEYETRPTEFPVGLEAVDVDTTDVLKLMASTRLTSPEDETRPTKSFVGLEADGVNTTGVSRIRNQANKVIRGS